MPTLTNLVISGVGVAPYSARGLKQSLAPIQQATVLMRTVNGILDDLGDDAFKKFASTITGRDQLAPPHVWPGLQIDVSCIAELCYLTASGTPEREVVAGSSRVEGDYTYYRPKITFRVVSLDPSWDEYDADVSWTLSLEEK